MGSQCSAAGRGLCGRTYVVHIAPVPHDSALFAVSQLDSQGDHEEKHS